VTRAGVGRLEQQSGRSITRLRDLQDTLEAQFGQALAAGMVTVKTTLAYLRSLRFEVAPPESASHAFEALMQDRTPPSADPFGALEQRPYKPLSDFMFHYLVQLAEAHRVPVQVHTGLHAGNANILMNSRPSDLTSLFYRYAGVTFDLFHVGFPFQHEAAVLAKTFPNACLDFCWMYVVSPSAAAATLHEVLDMVPTNKIMGFGGDYRYPELSYAHAVMARRVIAQVLEQRITLKICTEADALALAQQILHDNPARLFSPRAGK
jgi:predicted TIM-barrel fold metal-dependent hydrolase